VKGLKPARGGQHVEVKAMAWPCSMARDATRSASTRSDMGQLGITVRMAITACAMESGQFWRWRFST
jgi:hypothetical protein